MSRLEQRTPARPPARVRAGGRSERVRRHVARACLDLLAEDQLDLGPVEVADRAGVSRATIHRWWPTKEELLREALTLHTSVLDVPDTGTWAGDLRALATELAAFFSDPTEVSLNAIMASGTHPEFTPPCWRTTPRCSTGGALSSSGPDPAARCAPTSTPTRCCSRSPRRSWWSRSCSAVPPPTRGRPDRRPRSRRDLAVRRGPRESARLRFATGSGCMHRFVADWRAVAGVGAVLWRARW